MDAPSGHWPAMIEGGQVVARLRDSVPGPIVQSLPRAFVFSTLDSNQKSLRPSH
jgi:hypothetical protein